MNRVEFLWTWRTLPGSFLQMMVLNEDVSHFAIRYGPVVIHQVWDGFEIDWFTKWVKKYHIRYSLSPPFRVDTEADDFIGTVVDAYHGGEYDKIGWVYFSIRALLYKYGGIPLPKSNKWEDPKKRMCTGIAKIIQELYPDWFHEPIDDFDILTPKQLFLNMKASGKLEALPTSLD